MDISQIQGGGLPWDSGGSSMFSGGLAGLAQSYSNAYNAALRFNQQNYNNILGGYQTALQNQVGTENQIGQGYAGLTNQVLGDLSHLGTTQRALNDREYAQQSGAMAQQMIDRGLGNTTVQQSMQRGLVSDRALANNQVAEQVGNMLANYRSQLGQAGLGFKERAMGMNTGLQQAQLNWMNSVNAPYPNASAYSDLAQMYGAQAQADKNRQMLASLGGQMAGGYQGAGGGSGLTYGTGYQQPAWTYGYSNGDYGGGMPDSGVNLMSGQQGYSGGSGYASYNPYASFGSGTTTDTGPVNAGWEPYSGEPTYGDMG